MRRQAATAEGASPALEEREELLSPLDLLLAYQQTITAQAHSSDEAHGILDALMGLLEQIVPALALMPTFEPLANALASFLAQLPGLRGEPILQAEETLLAEITKAADRDRANHEADLEVDDDAERAAPRRMSADTW